MEKKTESDYYIDYLYTYEGKAEFKEYMRHTQVNELREIIDSLKAIRKGDTSDDND